MMDKRKNIRRYGWAVSVAAVAVMLVSASRTDFNIGRNLEILMSVFREINLFYVDEVDPDELMVRAADGMTSRLDPYTVFMPEEEMKNFEVLATGKYGGIGALIRQKEGETYISEPYKGSPADIAGLKVGDRILAIDGKEIRGMESGTVSGMLRGDPGTRVKVKVERFFTGEIETLTIRRERIVIPGVPYYGFVNDSVGYIKHEDFSDDSSNDLRAALMEMRATGNLKALILDYRNNGGGSLQEAVKTLSLFVPKGTEVVRMQGRMEEMSANFRTEYEPVDLDLPITVLVDGGTASAAEIVSGALQDLDRAVLIGQRTVGKGLVQTTRPTGYNSYIKMTTAKYYIPSGRCIQAIDYAHRSENGMATMVPDSLIKEFRTAAGRKVYDGVGIMPDIRMEPNYISRFTIVVYDKGYIEDFADDYARRHPEGIDADDFTVTDEDYALFVEFMKDKNVEFESETKQALAVLKRNAERELYSEQISDYLESIEARLVDDTESDLIIYRDQISHLLTYNLMIRFHYNEGALRYNLAHDNEIAEAVRLLADRGRYTEILSTKDTDRK